MAADAQRMAQMTPLVAATDGGLNLFSPGLFDLYGIVPVAYMLFALAAGVATGALIGRTVPAMALTTVVSAALALRYAAPTIAALGLIGGYLTPVLLSTGVDRPAGFVLPVKVAERLREETAPVWESSPWPLRRERLYAVER